MPMLWEGLVVVLFIGVGWLWYRQHVIQKDMLKVMEVLAAASPALERRIIERGTQVILGQQWVSDEVLDET